MKLKRMSRTTVAGAVIMPLIDFDEDPHESEYDLHTLRLIKDSKKMTKKIEIFVVNILKKAIDFGVGI